MKKRCFSLFLLAALLLSLAGPAALAQDETLHISSAEELAELAENCSLVEYSQGIEVKLDNDIDLEGRPFYPIASFSGSFDGGGHTIKNFVLATDGSHQGLFRYLQADGRIENLKLEGRVEPDNSRCQVGGIVGSSYGIIENCSFSGKVSGLNYVGGIAGENYGSINGCSSEGSISGKRFTGGIAGYNGGSISGCENRAEVNTGISPGGLELDKLSVTGMSLTGAEDTDVVSDSGGISGFSVGLIENSVNLGDIGYPHYGYNVGGIAGRQSGHISGCTNLGPVWGRKDVAGIVGQMEPNLKLLNSASLAQEIQTLQAMVSNMLAKAGYLTEEMRNALGSIRDSAGQTVEDLLFPDGYEPEWPFPSEEPEPSTQPEPSTEPEPSTQPEPSAEPEPSAQPEPSAEPEPSAQPEPSVEPAPQPSEAPELPAEQSAPLQTEPPAGPEPEVSVPEEIPAASEPVTAESLVQRENKGKIILLSSGELPDGGSGGEQPGTGESSGSIPDIVDNETLKDNLNQMASDMDYFNSVLGSTADSIYGDLNAVSNQMSKVLIMMTNALSGENKIDLYDDVSEQEPETSTQGRVRLCVNRGPVEGDSNIGGIAGDMGIEYEFDLENELMSVFSASNIISSTYQTRCIASENRNYGSISAKKNNAGGIAGQCQVGLVESCAGYGSVSSSEGGYAGGVVGNSLTLIRNCCAMCQLDGQEFVGGIAGYGSEITGCASLVITGDVTACCGAIAGWADMSAGAVDNNFYTSPGLGAVDGISYTGKAQPLEYEQLLDLKGLPEEFGQLKLSFVADGEPVAELPFEYGGSIDESSLPAVPEKRGYVGAWEDYDYSKLYISGTIEAVYTYRQGTLAAGTDGSGEKALVLTEGDFDSKASLSVREFTGAGPQLEQGTLREKWVLDIEGGGDGEYRVHYLRPELLESRGLIELYSYSGGVWTKLDYRTSGSYLIFDAQGDSFVFCSVEQESQTELGLLVLGGALALLAAGLIWRRRLKKKAPAAENLAE